MRTQTYSPAANRLFQTTIAHCPKCQHVATGTSTGQAWGALVDHVNAAHVNATQPTPDASLLLHQAAQSLLAYSRARNGDPKALDTCWISMTTDERDTYAGLVRLALEGK